MPSPPRHTGSRPPSRWISASRQRDVNVEGPLPRNQQRGSPGSACIATNGSIQPRCAPAIEQVAARRQVLLARGVDPEPEEPEQHEPGDERGGTGTAATRGPPARGRASRGPRAHRRARRRAPPGGPARAAASAGDAADRSCQASPDHGTGAARRAAPGSGAGADRLVEVLEVVVRISGVESSESSGVVESSASARAGVRGAGRPGARRSDEQTRSRSPRTRHRRSGPSGCRRFASSRCAGTPGGIARPPIQITTMGRRSPTRSHGRWPPRQPAG